jgi:hypothetical protein
VAGLEGRNGTTPGLAPLDSPAEPAGVSAPF